MKGKSRIVVLVHGMLDNNYEKIVLPAIKSLPT